MVCEFSDAEQYDLVMTVSFSQRLNRALIFHFYKISVEEMGNTVVISSVAKQINSFLLFFLQNLKALEVGRVYLANMLNGLSLR